MRIETTPAQTEPEDRTVALLSYLTIVSFIIALPVHSSKKTKFGAFHFRQGLGLALTFMVLRMAMNFIPYGQHSYNLYAGISELLRVLYVLLVVSGLIAVTNGKEKALPVVGELYHKWFGGSIEGAVPDGWERPSGRRATLTNLAENSLRQHASIPNMSTWGLLTPGFGKTNTVLNAHYQ